MPLSPAADGLQRTRAIVSMLLADDAESYSSLVRAVSDADETTRLAVIGCMAGMLAGQVTLAASYADMDPLDLWVDGIRRSQTHGV